jgi:hypothetical protein
MPPQLRTASIVLISFLLAFAGFMIVSWNTPTEVKVTREDAITIVKTNVKVDPEKNIVKDEWLRSAELQYMSIDWSNPPQRGSHRRLYVSTTPVGVFTPYWFIDYSSLGLESFGIHDYTYGSYVVDAITGELMLALEGSGGPWPGPDFLTSSTPAYAHDPYFPVEIKQSQSREVIVRCTAQPSFDASLPMSIRVTSVPKGFVVTQNATSGILRTGGALTVKLVITSSANAPAINPPPFDSTRPHVEIEIGLFGMIYRESIYIKLVP